MRKLSNQSMPLGRQAGIIIIYEVIIMFIFSTLMVAVVSYSIYQLRLVHATTNREEAFQLAEAGNDYYQWHLAHFPTDYQDGTGKAGPYVHSYVDEDTQKVIGYFSLTITPPSTGSTIVTIASTGYTVADPNSKRIVTTKYGIPSLAKYAFLTNSDAWIGPSETVNGPFDTNGGVRFDGTGTGPITSAKQTYTCQSWSGTPCPATENGIWGAASAATKNFWSFPQPNVDFSTITSDLATIKTQASASGIYLAPSNKDGYSLVFNAAGTVSVYKVTSVKSDPTGWDVNGVAQNASTDYNARTLQFTEAIPANGLIYVEDQTWVEGTVKGRVLVVAANLPYNSSTAPSIIIPNNIVYAAKDGTDELGLIGQQNILVSYGAPNNLEIDAAMIAQNGSAEMYYYPGDTKNTITIYGATSSYGTWTWNWVDGNNNNVSGYANTDTTYDTNLLYGPPPSFPESSSGYQQISWSSN